MPSRTWTEITPLTIPVRGTPLFGTLRMWVQIRNRDGMASWEGGICDSFLWLLLQFGVWGCVLLSRMCSGGPQCSWPLTEPAPAHHQAWPVAPMKLAGSQGAPTRGGSVHQGVKPRSCINTNRHPAPWHSRWLCWGIKHTVIRMAPLSLLPCLDTIT